MLQQIKEFLLIIIFIYPNGPAANQFPNMTVDKEDNLWSASGKDVTGVGFYKYNKSNGKFIMFSIILIYLQMLITLFFVHQIIPFMQEVGDKVLQKSKMIILQDFIPVTHQ